MKNFGTLEHSSVSPMNTTNSCSKPKAFIWNNGTTQ